jgi:hypothetical protein
MNDDEKKLAWEQERPIWESYYRRLMKLPRRNLLEICDLPEIGLTFYCPGLGDTDPLKWRRTVDEEQIVMALLCDFNYDTINRAVEKVTGRAIVISN